MNDFVTRRQQQIDEIDMLIRLMIESNPDWNEKDKVIQYF